MIRIRFHGRGGHGVKTASRILGTAAFRAGYVCQDSPIYGAERRGAAVTAFTRISREAILERGMIAQPDLIILGDETLLDDASAGVLGGQETAAALLINTPDVTRLTARYTIRPQVVAVDITDQTRQLLGRGSALSAGLAAAAARLVGRISEPQLIAAVREELSELEMAAEVIERNVQLARRVYADVPEVLLPTLEMQSVGQVVPLDYTDAVSGAPSVLSTGNAGLRNTGSWRVERPVIDTDICTRCGLCLVVCPDGAIALDEEGYPVIDYDHCKGCLICRQRCPVEAIGRQRETRAW